MKKLLSILLVAVMLVTCMTVTAFAAKAGDTVEINFTASNPGAAVFGAKINYNSSVLELVSISRGALASEGMFSGTASTGKVAYLGENNITGSGILFVAKFKVLDAAVAGETYPVTATVDTSTTADAEGNLVSFSISGGSVKIDDCDHEWGSGVVTTPATCENPGVRTYTCSKCGGEKTEPIDPIGHKWDDGVVTTPATCEVPGVKTYTCQNDNSHTKDEAIDPIGHKWDDGVVTTPATCGDPGVKTFTCQNDSSHTKTEVIDPTGNHKNGTYTKIDGNDKQHKVSCSVCGKEDELENHSWDNGTVTTPATCGQPGSKTLTCTKCGYEKTEVIDATGKHTYTYTDVNDDQHKVVCSVCGDESMENHNYNAGVVTTKPGHLPGEKTYTCADCGGTKVEVIDPTSDKHVLNSNGWTSYDDTYHYGECECGETMKEKHDWKWVTDKEATKTEAGEKHEECECGAKRNEGTVIKPGKDPVPDTGDITSQVVMTGAVALVVMMGAVALVFKRKNAK